jgi:hypothetical protein
MSVKKVVTRQEVAAYLSNVEHLIAVAKEAKWMIENLSVLEETEASEKRLLYLADKINDALAAFGAEVGSVVERKIPAERGF